MVSCRSIRGVRPLGGSSPRPRSFFDLWSEYEAHELTFEILRTLGFKDPTKDAEYDGDSHRAHMRAFDDLPDPSFVSPVCLPFSLIQARALFSKNDDFESGIDKEQVSYQSWLKSEQQCAETNLRWSTGDLSREAKIVAHYATQFIARVLGPVPSLADLDLRFGPGATTSCSNKTSARWKLSSPLTASNSLFSLQGELRATIPGWLSENSNLPSPAGWRPWIPSVGALEFVPKNYKTFRAIDIQPTLNTLVQKGIGTYLKRRLFVNGINLYDQNINKERARLGSIHNDIATIDLERASDTMAYIPILHLLPTGWFNLLDAARTGFTSYRGKLFSLNKFSSMGNGFTFELESLLFASIAYGVEQMTGSTHNTTVYGDDIITSVSTGRVLQNILPEFGFSINSEKSFFDGPFRESCGGDYAFGIDVRPFFLKGLRGGGRWTYAKCVSFHNFLQRKPWFDPTCEVRRLLVSKLPVKYQNWGPDGYGDGHLVSHAPLRDYALRPSRIARKGYEGYVIRSAVAIPSRDDTPLPYDSYLPSYLAGTGPNEGVNVIRTSKTVRMRDKLVDMYVV